ncbi:MAG: hypothetical protein L6V89_04530 [Oscillospiraceae bacterium]|nr:MAG: hypothetical protein L6V89_04530 [Oscillospiraceae bacterium]
MRQKEIQGITAASVKQSFIECEDFISADRESLRKNFNTLITALNINLTRLCQYTNYDPSAIFRIRSGSRNPGDCEQFASGIAAFTAREMQTQPEIAAVAELIGCDPDDIHDISPRYTLLKKIGCSVNRGTAPQTAVYQNFLTALMNLILTNI